MKRQERAVRDGADDAVFSRIASGQKMSAERATDCVAEMARETGFNHYLLAEFPRGDRSGFASNCLACNGHKSSLISMRRLMSSLAVNWSQRSRRQRCRSSAIRRRSRARRQTGRTSGLRRSSESTGLKTTFAFALHDMHLRYASRILGERAHLTRAEVMEQVFRAMEFLELFGQQNLWRSRPKASAAGKSNACAGRPRERVAKRSRLFLTLSAHTVVGYLKSAMRKLDSVNRMQAIARAFRYRLL